MSTIPTPVSQEELAVVARAFGLAGQFLRGAPHGSGHINDTFAVELVRNNATTRYILQRINHRIFTDVPALMENIQRVTAHLRAKTRATLGPDAAGRVLTLVPQPDGCPFHRDPLGCFWRCYVFIEGARTYDVIETTRQAFEAARAFGHFQRLLVDLPGPRLRETIPNFHHTRKRFEALCHAVAEDRHDRAGGARAEIDFVLGHEAIVDVLQHLHDTGAIPERVTHNDTKLNNVMLDDRTQEAVSVIDLDTVMPGFALHDFGDMVRSATNSAAEDERDLSRVAMRLPMYEALVAGYLSAAGGFLNATERAHLAFAGRLITFEIGLRFLTDHLAGDVYFKVHRPGHNLDRARNQFALVRSIEQQEPAMRAVAEQTIHAA